MKRVKSQRISTPNAAISTENSVKDTTTESKRRKVNFKTDCRKISFDSPMCLPIRIKGEAKKLNV